MSTRLTAEPFEDVQAIQLEEASTEPARIPETEFVEEARKRYRALNIRLPWSDALCLVTALSLTQALRFGQAPITVEYGLVLLIAPLAWVAVFQSFGLYAPQRMSAPEELRRVISACCVGLVVVMLASFWSDLLVSRRWIAWTLLFTLALQLTSRLAWRAYAKRMQEDGRLALRTLIVGTKQEVGGVARTVGASGSGFSPIGYIDLFGPLVSEELPPQERAARLRRAIRENGADCLFIASPRIGYQAMLGLAQVVRQEGIEMRLYAPLSGVLSSRLTVQAVGTRGMALTLKPAYLSRSQRAIKRVFDLIASAIGLVILLPVMLLTAAAIKMTSPGPVFFRQNRVTKAGRVFSVYKFRTMYTDGDSLLHEQEVDQATPFFKIKDDPRLTRVGKKLRNWSLDEIPQLINVVRGEMSLVGPRPLPQEQVSANVDILGPRHEVRAGVTGWWQINGRSDVSSDEALRMDLFYIENWSLSLDLYILAKTVWVLGTRSGAY